MIWSNRIAGIGKFPHAGNWRTLFTTAALAIATLSCAPQHSDVTRIPVTQEIISSSVRFQKEYVLVAGDQIEISVWRTPEVSRTVVIRADGYVSLPLLQDVPAAGRSPRELAAAVKVGLSTRFVDPEVTVIPLTIRQPTIYVLGDVKSPGPFPIRAASTVAHALAAAGGPLRSASESDISLIRLSDSGYLEAIPVQTGSSLNQSSPYLALAATQLKADDIIFVPEGGRSQIVRLLQDLLLPIQIYLNYKLISDVL